jgi:hypothetical protein
VLFFSLFQKHSFDWGWSPSRLKSTWKNLASIVCFQLESSAFNRASIFCFQGQVTFEATFQCTSWPTALSATLSYETHPPTSMNSSHHRLSAQFPYPLVSTFCFQCLVRKSPNRPSGQTLCGSRPSQPTHRLSSVWEEQHGVREMGGVRYVGGCPPRAGPWVIVCPSYAGMAAAAAHGAVSGSPPPLADPSSAHECSIVWGRTLVLVATYWAIHGFDL